MNIHTDAAHSSKTGSTVHYAGVFFATYVLAGGLVSLLGWVLDIQRLSDWWNTGITIKANTAMGLIAAALGLEFALLWPRLKFPIRLLGIFSASLGALTLIEHLASIDLHIDTLLFNEAPGALAVAAPGRMGPPAAISLLLAGIALHSSTKGNRGRAKSCRCAILIIGIAMLSITGYWYGATAMYMIPRLTGIAIQTATMLLALGIGILAALPERNPARILAEDSNAGMLARRLIPVSFIVPFFLGWLHASGQRVQLYDPAFGAAVRTIIEVLILAGILWWIIQAIREHDMRRRELEAQRLSSELRLAQTLENMTDGFFTLDANWRFTYVNAEAEGILGRRRYALIGRVIWELFPEGATPELRERFERAARERTMFELEDAGIASKAQRYFRARVYPGLDGGLSVYLQDVTTRKVAEDALKEADKRKDIFLATLAHELRNPLAPIRNAAAALQHRSATGATLQWAAGIIQRQVRHMARLLDDLLDVSRISRNRLELRKECVELSDIVGNAVETSQPAIDAGAHTLDVRLPKERLFIDGDPVRLAQIFSNLLNNAAKYTPSGGRIVLSADASDDEVVVCVADNGVGMDNATLPRIFEMFAQAPAANTGTQEGLGIGLALVRGIVELHGGHIEARSEGAGKGSEFFVHLPRLAMSAETAIVAAEPGSAQGRRILVVDDLRDNADALVTLLNALGHTTFAAYDGREALEAGERLVPEVVLLDIGMPEMDGLESCRRMRETGWGRNAKIIAMTGWGQKEDLRRTREAGFDAHLIKPADIDELLALLSSASPIREANSSKSHMA